VLLRIVTPEGDIVERRITETAGIELAGVILYTRSAKGKVTIARIDDFGSHPRPGLRGEWSGGLPWLAWLRVVVAGAVILPLLGWWMLGVALG
jgi:hypothetical protein